MLNRMGIARCVGNAPGGEEGDISLVGWDRTQVVKPTWGEWWREAQGPNGQDAKVSMCSLKMTRCILLNTDQTQTCPDPQPQ
jgi:hypothetical protein